MFGRTGRIGAGAGFGGFGMGAGGASGAGGGLAASALTLFPASDRALAATKRASCSSLSLACMAKSSMRLFVLSWASVGAWSHHSSSVIRFSAFVLSL